MFAKFIADYPVRGWEVGVEVLILVFTLGILCKIVVDAIVQRKSCRWSSGYQVEREVWKKVLFVANPSWIILARSCISTISCSHTQCRVAYISRWRISIISWITYRNYEGMYSPVITWLQWPSLSGFEVPIWMQSRLRLPPICAFWGSGSMLGRKVAPQSNCNNTESFHNWVSIIPPLGRLHLHTRAPISGANQYSKFHHYMEKSRTACIEFSYASLHLLIYFPFFLCTCRISFSPPEYVFKWISWASWPGAGEQTVISFPIPVGGLQTVERTLIHFCTSKFPFFANV